jgi:hypothetical protein
MSLAGIYRVIHHHVDVSELVCSIDSGFYIVQICYITFYVRSADVLFIDHVFVSGCPALSWCFLDIGDNDVCTLCGV